MSFAFTASRQINFQLHFASIKFCFRSGIFSRKHETFKHLFRLEKNQRKKKQRGNSMRGKGRGEEAEFNAQKNSGLLLLS